MNILFCSYRDWSLEVVNSIISNEKDNYLSIDNPKELEKTIEVFQPDIIFFIGWSWLVPEHIINSYVCLCIHPSELPKYRGGSPIQNQIIDGIIDSAVTLFIMNHELDAGDIIYQQKLNLDGDLNDILKRISYISIKLINDCITYYRNNKKFYTNKQNDAQATYCKRRKPGDSEITLQDINTMSALQLHNKVRSLQDPYPNAYITLGSGEKLYILKTKI